MPKKKKEDIVGNGELKEEYERIEKEPIETEKLEYDNKSLYFGYSSRVSVLMVLFAVLAIICAVLANRIMNYKQANAVKFIEVGKITHQAVLKENDIYEKNIIKESDKLTYVSGLVDKIQINYSYNLNFNKDVQVTSNNKIIAELTIYDPKSKNNYFTQKYELTNDLEENFEGNKTSLNKMVSIDYDKYNKLASEFKSKYNKNAKAKLDVKLLYDASISPMKMNAHKNYSSNLVATISLGETNVNIVKSELDNTISIPFKQKRISLYSVILELLLIIFIICVIVVFVKLNKLLAKLQPQDNEYDKERKRILDEYDNIIVNVSILPNLKKYKEVKIYEFEELLDLKENVNEPIRYMEVAPHNKCYFFIKHNEEVFVYTLKNTSKER